MKYIVGNWKMYLDREESIALAEKVVECTPIAIDTEVILCPSEVVLEDVAEIIAGHEYLSLGAQNIGIAEKGRYTGDTAVQMLEEVQVKYALVGHSERRHVFHETEEMIQGRLKTAAESPIIPILCVGETQEAYTEGKEAREEYVKKQIFSALEVFPKDQPLLIAYEPVWAIGSGKMPSIEEIVSMHHFIEKLVQEEQGRTVPVLYGGSINADSASELLAEEAVGGILIGGASVNAEQFCMIIRQK